MYVCMYVCRLPRRPHSRHPTPATRPHARVAVGQARSAPPRSPLARQMGPGARTLPTPTARHRPSPTGSADLLAAPHAPPPPVKQACRSRARRLRQRRCSCTTRRRSSPGTWSTRTCIGLLQDLVAVGWTTSTARPPSSCTSLVGLEHLDQNAVGTRTSASLLRLAHTSSVIHSLGDNEVEVRRKAAGGLPYFRKDKDAGSAVSALTQALKDEEAAVREEAAAALGRFRLAALPAVTALKSLATKETDEGVRQAVSKALKKILGGRANLKRRSVLERRPR